MSLATQPQTLNFLSQLEFRFTLERAPNVTWHLTRCNLPGININNVDVPTPFKRMNFDADKLEYGQLMLTFKVDEKFANWSEIYDWLIGIGFPNEFDQRRLLVRNGSQTQGRGVLTDGSLIILNSAKNPIIEIKFKDLKPTSLSDLEFTTQSSDVEFLECTATFDFQDYEPRLL
jgi:hypothetical protein